MVSKHYPFSERIIYSRLLNALVYFAYSEKKIIIIIKKLQQKRCAREILGIHEVGSNL